MDCSDLPESINELSVLFSDNRELKDLNAAFRNKDAVTDVLSFSQIEGDGGFDEPTCLGDVVISLERASEQAADFGNTFEQEVLRLLVHGILHLFGFDHENVPESEVQRMQAEEDRLFEQFALPPGSIITD